MRIHNQRGSAVLTALLIVALVVALWQVILVRQNILIDRTRWLINNEKQQLFSEGVLLWATETLLPDTSHTNFNPNINKMPQSFQQKTDNDSLIQGTLLDAQARFNINNLILPNYRPVFSRLLRIIDPTVSIEAANIITQHITFWIMPEINPQPEDIEYLHGSPPYQVAHGLFTSISELALVKGMTPHLFSQLSPYIIALPEVTKININTAPATVLAALSKTVDLSKAQNLIQARAMRGNLLTLKEFEALPEVKSAEISSDFLTDSSHFFILIASLAETENRLSSITLLMQDMSSNPPQIIILWRSRGVL